MCPNRRTKRAANAFWIAVCILTTWTGAQGEELTVFTCQRERHMISRYAIGSQVEGDERQIFIDAFKPGKQVGVLDTGNRPFEPMFEAALKEPTDGFFGPGWTYILKSSTGAFYIVFFEYAPGNDRLKGTRFGIGKLSDLGSGKAVFVGCEYDGRCKDASILKQLKAITDHLIETKGKQ